MMNARKVISPLARLFLGGAFAVALIALTTLSACENDSYDTGDGSNSYLKAHFAEAHTTANAKLAFAVTDDGDTLRFPPNTSNKALTKADSVYRVLYYYDQRGANINPRSIVPIPVVALSDSTTWPTDPVTFESAWVSRNRKYFNIGFALKVGRTDQPDRRQRIGVVRDSFVTTAAGEHILYMHLAHSQNGVPQYYSQRVYISVPIRKLPANTRFVFRVQDYQRLITVERGG